MKLLYRQAGESTGIRGQVLLRMEGTCLRRRLSRRDRDRRVGWVPRGDGLRPYGPLATYNVDF